MNKLSDISYVKAVLQKHGFTFSKSLGQNFLVNPTVCPRMAQMCGASEKVGVIEIGPGAGVLTCELAKIAWKVVAVELDKRLLPVLDETLSDFDNIKVINADAIKLDFKQLIKEEFNSGEVVICANLPYYITSPVIMRLLEERLPINSLTVMVQKEAADRICAKPGTRESGAISAAVHYYSTPEMLFKVSAGSFIPAPKVDSAVIKLNILTEPPVSVTDEKMFFKVVKSSFLQRRKTLSNSLSSGMSISKQAVNEILIRAEIKQNARAEELSMEQFARISNIFSEINKKEKPD
ncbi:MAG: 16S rRNA (adenine(1518)-N(6)/adenine(1519)-N(6))-dimethyltransferase RsmA [Clostridia bacterium]|nr:16S rRNA (adenine(1518)-N(6)/adenine(1519)-N(6))-dimethyltransferase RsmA [Clostridia bacterium]